jgi:hypothetical protein
MYNKYDDMKVKRSKIMAKLKQLFCQTAEHRMLNGKDNAMLVKGTHNCRRDYSKTRKVAWKSEPTPANRALNH